MKKKTLRRKRSMTARKNITVGLPTVELRKLCDHAEATGLPEGPNAKFWRDVDQDGVHIISFNYPGTGVADAGGGKQWVRAMVMCKMRDRTQSQLLLCDFDYAGFTTLVNNAVHVKNRRRKSA